MPNGTLTVAEVAARYGVSESTVLAWIRERELAAVCVSRNRASRRPHWRVTSEALANFEAARSKTAPAPRGPRRKQRDLEAIEFYSTN